MVSNIIRILNMERLIFIYFLTFLLLPLTCIVTTDGFFLIPNSVDKKQCGKQLTFKDFRIVGGTEAKSDELPWQVGLKYLTKLICGGTLIAPRWALTTAHCFDFLAEIQGVFTVVAGIISLKDANTNNEVDVEKIIKHEGYNDKTFANDIALIKLSKTISNAQPACLPAKEEKFTGLTCVTSGWGSLNEHSNRTIERLRKVMVKVQSRSNCTQSIGKYFKEYHLCAGSSEGGKDSCSGDSGGPLVCLTDESGPRSDQMWTLAGIVTTGVGCGRPGKYGLYMDVSYYLGWINEIIHKEDSTSHSHLG